MKTTRDTYDDADITADPTQTLSERVLAFLRKQWKWVAAGAVLVIIISLVLSSMGSSKDKENEERVKSMASSASADPTANPSGADGVDTLLMEQQADLREKYGPAKDGFIWDIDGTLLSLGKKDMDPADVVYTYLRALNTLDFDTAQSFSRRSTVIDSYRSYFDSETSDTTDYADQFKRNVFRQSLLSLRVEGVVRSANFSDNKQVYTVTASMIDLSDKSFWEPHKQDVFNKLKEFNTTEEDTTKADIYLYDYVTNYYTSQVASLSDPQKAPKVKMRSVSFDLTLQRYPAQDSGWLVSIDKDLDLLAKYADGVSIIDYIKSKYQEHSLG